MKRRNVVLAFAFLAPFVSLGLALAGLPIAVALAPLFLSHLLLLYGSLVANSEWWGPVITSFRTAEQEVWITLDDGPSPASTLQLLEVLAQFQARATFFVVGANAEKYPHLVTEILARGHTLANHTWTHPAATFWCAGPGKIAREIDSCSATLRSNDERPPRYFRSPVGMKSPFLHQALARRGLAFIGWTVRGLDTVIRDPVRIAERIERGARPGAIILLHESRRADDDPTFSPRCLELTLQRLAAAGYRFVVPTAEQLLGSGDGKGTAGY